MKRRKIVFLIITVLALTVFSSGCGKQEEEKEKTKTEKKEERKSIAIVEYNEGKPTYKSREVLVPPRPDSKRLTFVTNKPIPKKYRSIKENPLIVNQENLDKGAALYKKNCASCHGINGRGDGEAGENLKPRPSDLYMVVTQPEATVGYLLWAITDGGKPFKSAMPSYKTLSKKNKWLLILHLRSLH